MNFEEAGELLARVAAFDRRTTGEPDIVAWGLALADVDYHDAAQVVVDHYKNSNDWITPADVRGRVARLRRERIAAAGPILPPAELADDPIAELAWLREARERIAAGQEQEPPQGVRALAGPGRRSLDDLRAELRGATS